jgi:hypothetical protein
MVGDIAGYHRDLDHGLFIIPPEFIPEGKTAALIARPANGEVVYRIVEK